jgi:serine/threonine protein kinase
MESPRWKIITQSQYEHERRALDFIRDGLPDHDPYRAWSNFEFQTKDGAIYEVDLLVLTKQGFWLIEIKSWSGRITGDVGTWTRSHNGKTVSDDNPVFLANRKAKSLSSILKAQAATKDISLPWLDAIVFLSADDLQCDLIGSAKNRVFLKDQISSETQRERKGILKAILTREGQGIDPDLRTTIDIRAAKSISRAIENAGIRPSQRSRRVGDYVLGDLIDDGPGYQDRLAKHVAFNDESVFCRVRQYNVAQSSDEDTRKKLQRAAAREFQIIQTLSHSGILPVLDYKDHELGPTLLFRYTDPNAERFDHYLAREGRNLTTDRRLGLLRQIADAIRYAHGKRVVHRALGPQSIIVLEAHTDTPVLQILNWQVGIQQAKSTTTQFTVVDDLVETQSLVYMSPEALVDPKRVSEASDIFSLGAIAFHLFTSRPPAASVGELAQILRERNGLSISAVLDGAGPRLEELIQWSTHPDVLTRIGTVDEFLALLDDVEDELTSPDDSSDVDPLNAKRGDRLSGGYVVERVLGQGATARALLVTKDTTQYVLKVALTDDDNARLQEEARALKSIRSEFVVNIYDTLQLAGKTVLVLQKAGEESLATLLRKYGVPTLDLLARYGENLLSAVASLERHGVLHRDIKPENIGIHSLRKQQNQLILYDFSLTSVPLDNLLVGTSDYRDPFLKNRKLRKWDLAAERYSAGVTLYEMTMGHNQLPKWGKEGVSDPAATEDELFLDEEKFKPSVRSGLATFFKKALHRNPDMRFDSAEEMSFGWQKVFKDAENQTVKNTTGEEIATSIPIEQAELDTLVAALDLSVRARDALDGLNLSTVKDLLQCPSNSIHMMRGVGDQYRREIIGFVAELRQKFPDITGKKTSVKEDDAAPSLERLFSRVLGVRAEKDDIECNIRACLLNVDAKENSPTDIWPSQSRVAERLGSTRAKVGQVLATDQKRWSKDGMLSTFRNALFEQIQKFGGVASIAELVETTILLRPATDTQDAIQQQRLASAIARAAIETELAVADPRIHIRRMGGKTIVACSSELESYVEKLGELADRISMADPLLPRLRLFQEVYNLPQPASVPGCHPFSNERLIKLAAALSSNAAVSSRQEIYPRNMPAERALRLGIGALSGLGLGNANEGIKIDQVHARVRSRYPEAQSLPLDPNELESMLQRVGIDVFWDSDKQVFRRSASKVVATLGSSIGLRHTTATSTRHIDSTAPENVQARADEDRLQHAFRGGGFLILTVKPSRMRDCERELLHRFDLEKISFDRLLFNQLQAKSTEYEFPWTDIYEADTESKSSDDWRNLLHVVSEVTPLIASDLMQRERPLLLVHAGLIARYDQMSLLQTLRDRVGHDAACPSLWVLVASDSQSEMPYLDGVQIPLISTGQRAFVSEFWIDNLHRGRTDRVSSAKQTGRNS